MTTETRQTARETAKETAMPLPPLPPLPPAFPPLLVRGLNDCPPLLDAGRSRRGWSRIGTFAVCAQKYAYQEVLGLRLISADALKAGSIGHVMQAHDLAKIGAAQGGVVVNETLLTEPDLILDPVAAAEEWAAQNEAASLVPALVDTWRRYKVRFPVTRGRVIAVEHEVVGVVVQGHRDLQYQWAPRYDMSDADPRCWTFSDQRGAPLVPHRLSNGEPVVLSRRWDAAFLEPDERYYVWDHKHTGANVKPERAQRAYAMEDGFVAITILGCQVFGDAFGGTRLNIIQRRSPFAVAQPLIGGHSNMIVDFAARLTRLEERRIDAECTLDPWRYDKAASEASACEGVYGECAAMNLCLHGKVALEW